MVMDSVRPPKRLEPNSTAPEPSAAVSPLPARVTCCCCESVAQPAPTAMAITPAVVIQPFVMRSLRPGARDEL
jgi:hypothetical protein